MMAAVEIYNKPVFRYRDECVVLLLLNAWELALKAALSKNRKSIFYPKKRGRPYRTLSWQDALTKGRDLFPRGVEPLPVQRNLELLATYRNNTVHFYNEADFGLLLYALAQTCIKNFRDYVEGVFGQRLEEEFTWQILPLGFESPVDVLAFISRGGRGQTSHSSAVRQFLSQLAQAAAEVEGSGADRGRLMTVFSVKLESVKKIGDADAVVAVDGRGDAEGPLMVVSRQDPNITHPLRQKEIVEAIKTLHGRLFTSYVFQAIAWKHGLKENPKYCWKAREGVLTRYSRDVLAFIRRLSAADVGAALTDYRMHRRKTKAAARRKRAL